MNYKDLKKNSEGYSDPTACKAIEHADYEYNRYRKVIGCILRVCEIAGYRVEGRIVLKDKRTGKIWR